jgi:hypothetical protein
MGVVILRQLSGGAFAAGVAVAVAATRVCALFAAPPHALSVSVRATTISVSPTRGNRIVPILMLFLS